MKSFRSRTRGREGPASDSPLRGAYHGLRPQGTVFPASDQKWGVLTVPGIPWGCPRAWLRLPALRSQASPSGPSGSRSIYEARAGARPRPARRGARGERGRSALPSRGRCWQVCGQVGGASAPGAGPGARTCEESVPSAPPPPGLSHHKDAEHLGAGEGHRASRSPASQPGI